MIDTNREIEEQLYMSKSERILFGIGKGINKPINILCEFHEKVIEFYLPEKYTIIGCIQCLNDLLNEELKCQK